MKFTASVISSFFAAALLAVTGVNTVAGSTLAPLEVAARQLSPPSFVGGSWIWSNNSDGNDTPAGVSAFRITIPQLTTTPVNISVAITADNAYNLYLNGNFIGTGLNFGAPDQWNILNVPGNVGSYVFSVTAINYIADGSVNTAGLIAAFEFSDTLGPIKNFWTGGVGVKMLAVPNVPEGFQNPDFDDSAWSNATVIGPYGIAPWGFLITPIPGTTCGF